MIEKMINRVICGNALTVLRGFPADSIDCVITSPPYWGLRTYKTVPQIWGGDPACEHQWGDGKIIKIGRNDTGTVYYGDGNPRAFGGQKAREVNQGSFCSLCNAWRGELGSEPQISLYLDHLLSIFAEVKRTLKPTGTLFCNIADSYAGSGKGIGSDHGKAVFTDNDIVKTGNSGIPPKSLCGIPERFAIRMTDELGMIRRNTIIWWKRNCMPSSASDRLTVDFEPIYFFTKTGKYWFKTQRELTGNESSPEEYESHKVGSFHIHTEDMEKGWMQPKVTGFKSMTHPDGRNRRCVWDIPTKPSNEDHYATFPDTLVSPMLDAGCPPDGIVLDPFSGMGTVAKTAIKQGKNFIMIELSEEYAEKSEKVLDELLSQERLVL